MRILQNLTNKTPSHKLKENTQSLAKSLKNISSGMKINSAADGAAELAISEKLRAVISALNVDLDNEQSQIGMDQTADSGLSTIGDSLQRIRELNLQASNSTLTENDRNAIQEEVSQLQDQIDKTAKGTEYNTQKLISDFTSDKIGISKLDIGTDKALNSIDQALQNISLKRGEYGAQINGSENRIMEIQVARENIFAAESNIRDTDITSEMVELTKNKILSQASISAISSQMMNSDDIYKLLN